MRRPALPLRHHHGYAAVLLRGLPTSKINPVQEFLPRRAVRTAIQPRSTGFEPAEVLRGFTPLVPRVHLPVSLAGPAPSGGSGASRRCRGCSPPDPANSPCPATPCFCRPAATGRRRGSHTRTRIISASWRTVFHLHSVTWRLVAHPAVLARQVRQQPEPHRTRRRGSTRANRPAIRPIRPSNAPCQRAGLRCDLQSPRDLLSSRTGDQRWPQPCDLRHAHIYAQPPAFQRTRKKEALGARVVIMSPAACGSPARPGVPHQAGWANQPMLRASQGG